MHPVIKFSVSLKLIQWHMIYVFIYFLQTDRKSVTLTITAKFLSKICP